MPEKTDIHSETLKEKEKDSEKQMDPLAPPPSVDGSTCDLNVSVSSLDSKTSLPQTSFQCALPQPV